MRISTNMLYSAGTKNINEQWSATLKLQQQVSTGKRILTPSDDPVAAAQALTVQQYKDINTQFATNIKYATSAVSYEEGQLGSVVDIFGSLKELAVQAQNTSLLPEQRSAIAAELRVRFDGLMAIANSTDETGQYLFAGYKGDTRPFYGSVDGTLGYAGDDGARQMQISPSRVLQTSDPGSAVFVNIANGNGVFTTSYDSGNSGSATINAGTLIDGSAWVDPSSGEYTLEITGGGTTYELRDGATVLSSGTYTSGDAISLPGASVTLSGTPADGDRFTIRPSENQSLFESMANLIHAVESTGTSDAAKAQYQMDVRAAATDLDNAFNHIVNVRGTLGGRLNELDAVSGVNTDMNIQYASTLSDLQDVDMVTATSELSQRLVQLQAAQKAFTMTTDLSLFSYL